MLAFGAAISWVLYTYYVVKMEKNDGVDGIFTLTFWGVVPFTFSFSNMSIKLKVKV